MAEHSRFGPGAEGDEQLPPEVIAQAQAVAGSNEDTAAEPHFYRNSRLSNQQTLSTHQEGHPAGFMVEVPIEDAPPPAYSESYGRVNMSQLGLNTRANVANDGRLDVTIDEKSRRLSYLLVPALRSQLHLQQAKQQATPSLPGYIPQALGGRPGQAPPPRLNVVIHVVGSRGDVQPFVALGQVLKKAYGHRVRLATHPVFKDFVQENGLEFFSIGGDPAELMAFMVKNPGLMPGKDALRSGDIGKRRKGMYEIVRGCWRSCFEAGDGTGVEVSDKQMDQGSGYDGDVPHGADPENKPFVADAIIANPPSFAHVHCAEKLGVPLHLMFTMPWSPTQAFPHPLANIRSSNADVSLTNFITYALVEMMTWQGLGDVINRFREKSLGLEPLSLMWAPGIATRLRVPFTYCWSPALIPKPKDWGPHISVSGFFFLPLAQDYTPAADLAAFLEAGPPPVYIGFGSIVVNDPDGMTKLIFEAVKMTGQRAIVSKGWGGLGADSLGVPEGIFMLGNVPHDWLFIHVSCVVHHGGAGTTAAGIALGKPTVIVPFFGDQPFWGAMIAKAGAGPLPIPYKQLTAEKLANAIGEALKSAALERAQELGRRIGSENGSDTGARSFHTALEVDTLRCSLAPSRAAVWRVKRTDLRLSAFAAATLGTEGFLDFNELKLYRAKEYDSEDGPWEPISGATAALLGTLGSMMMGVTDFPVELFKAFASKSPEDRKDDTNYQKPVSEGGLGAAPGIERSDPAIKVTLPSQASSHPSSTTLVSSEHDLTRLSTPDILNSRTASMLGQLSPSPSLQLGSGIQASLAASLKTRSEQTRESAHAKSHESFKESSRPSAAQPSSEGNNFQTSLDAALGAGKGVSRIVGAGLKSPMDFTLSLAKGFHNAPKLYGDESVRQADRITGFQSGLRAAGKEFGFGFYDGISGLVTQPLQGAKKEGIAGLLKGFGKGIGGVVLKPGAAIWGLPGYTFQGIYKELQKYLGSSVQNYIIAARTAQGYEDWRTSSPQERHDIVAHWHEAQIGLGKQKKQWRNLRQGPSQEGPQQRHPSLRNRPEPNQEETLPSATGPRGLGGDLTAPLSHDGAEYEKAIRESVDATSTGNAEEDDMIREAIRASVAELQRASREGDDQDALERAIQTSVIEAKRARSRQSRERPGSQSSIGAERDRELEVALRTSMRGQGGLNELHDLQRDGDDSDVETDDDENIMLAIERSKQSAQTPSVHGADDLLRAMTQSQEKQQNHERKEIIERMEEDIVLEYVKKLSLAEGEHKRSLAANDGGPSIG